MSLNRQVPTAPPRMGELKRKMTSCRSGENSTVWSQSPGHVLVSGALARSVLEQSIGPYGGKENAL